MSLDWLFDRDRLPYTWASAFYASVRAVLFLIAYVATLAAFTMTMLAVVGSQM